jgi:hypothetical protein
MKKFEKALLAFIDFGHFINVQNAKGPPDFMQKTRFFILEHNAAICDFYIFVLLP